MAKIPLSAHFHKYGNVCCGRCASGFKAFRRVDTGYRRGGATKKMGAQRRNPVGEGGLWSISSLLVVDDVPTSPPSRSSTSPHKPPPQISPYLWKGALSPPRSTRDGFTLMEVMVSLFFLIVAAMALLQGLDLAFRHYSLAQTRWNAIVGLWNQIEQSRATSSTQGEPIQIIPDSRPLYRTVYQDPRLGEEFGWEVLSAEK